MRASLFNRVEQMRVWMLKHERALSLCGLFFGFFWDSLTSNSPDQIFANLSLISYFLISALGIVLMGLKGNEGTLGPVPLRTLVQFSFGNITGALFILYAKSGTWVGSGIFLATLLAFLFLNETMRSQYARSHVQLSIWFLLLLPYMVLAVPIVLNEFGTIAFMVGVASACAAFALLYTLTLRTAKKEGIAHIQTVVRNVVVISTVFSGMYVLNLIPPVPLSLSHIGIYHHASRTMEGNYRLVYEMPKRFEFWRDTSDIFTTRTAGEPVFCFASVFAPDKFNLPVYHRWQNRDSEGKWQTVSLLAYAISGGREEGFRGYTFTHRVTEGEWRCSVETERGVLIGRVDFTVVKGLPKLVEVEM